MRYTELHCIYHVFVKVIRDNDFNDLNENWRYIACVGNGMLRWH